MQLSGIMSLKKGQPAVNQCELCVGTHDDATIEFCKEKGIVYESYGALRSVDLQGKEITAIATAHSKSTTQPISSAQ